MKESPTPASAFDALVDTARRKTMEAEAAVLDASSSMRTALTQLEEENRQLRQTVEQQQVEILTEREFAKRLKVSPQTIARLRKRGAIEPLMVSEHIRYTSTTHLAKLEEIFAAKKRRLA